MQPYLKVHSYSMRGQLISSFENILLMTSIYTIIFMHITPSFMLLVEVRDVP